MTQIEELKDRVERLEKLTEALMLALWHQRGEMRGMAGKIDKEIEPFFHEWLKRGKMSETTE